VKKRSQRETETTEAWGLMGGALTLMHEIESDLAHAIFVGLTEKQKRKYPTLSALIEARKKMTFGQLVGLMKEQWEITPEFDGFLDMFVEERNHLVHDLTVLPGFSVDKARDRKKLIRRVGLFVQACYLARRIFRGAAFASIDFMAYRARKQGFKIDIQTSEEIELRMAEFFDVIGKVRREPQ
jgi:hypothetical protein